MPHIRVLLADDHALVRQGIRTALELVEDIEVVGEAADGERALALAKQLTPDVIVCDVRLPVLSGIEVVRQLKHYSPNTKILILSAFDNDEFIFETIANGATGYLLKTTAANELPDAVRKANVGQMVLDPPAAAKLSRMLGGALKSSGQDLLSSREMDILGLAAQGLKNKEIAKKLNLSTRTIEGHFARIFMKLSVSSRVEAINAGLARRIIDPDKRYDKSVEP